MATKRTCDYCGAETSLSDVTVDVYVTGAVGPDQPTGTRFKGKDPCERPECLTQAIREAAQLAVSQTLAHIPLHKTIVAATAEENAAQGEADALDRQAAALAAAGTDVPAEHRARRLELEQRIAAAAVRRAKAQADGKQLPGTLIPL